MIRRVMPKTPGGRVTLAIVAVIAGLNLFVVVLDALAPTPGGRPSSSLATAPRGLAAWAELAGEAGHEVQALRRDPSDGGLPLDGTVVVLDAPGLPDEDLEALRSFAESGGHVVAGGRHGDRLAEGLLDGAVPSWEGGGSKRHRALLPVAQTRGVAQVRTAGEGTWSDAQDSLPVLAGEDGVLLLVARTGRGRVSLLADSSPLQNRLLDQADNAALALALAGQKAGALAFLETPHGYGEARGLRALPSRIQAALLLLAAAALLLMAARGRRMGPPETLERPLPPPRAAYVDSLANVLSRKPDVVALGERARRAALDRLRTEQGGEAAVSAGIAAGLTPDEAQALGRPVEDSADALAAGRALARLEERAAAPTGRIA